MGMQRIERTKRKFEVLSFLFDEKKSRFNKEKSDVEQLVGRIKKFYISKRHVTTIREQPYSRSLKFNMLNIYLFIYVFLFTHILQLYFTSGQPIRGT